MLAPPTDYFPWNAEFYLQHGNDRIEGVILLIEHSNCVQKLHGNLQKKSALGESVHEAN